MEDRYLAFRQGKPLAVHKYARLTRDHPQQLPDTAYLTQVDIC
jgi:hypothetical protein